MEILLYSLGSANLIHSMRHSHIKVFYRILQPLSPLNQIWPLKCIEWYIGTHPKIGNQQLKKTNPLFKSPLIQPFLALEDKFDFTDMMTAFYEF